MMEKMPPSDIKVSQFTCEYKLMHVYTWKYLFPGFNVGLSLEEKVLQLML
jgi:hypothetical protein